MEGVHHPSQQKEVKHFQLITHALHRLRPFRNHDVPAYYHRLNASNLLNSRGQRVDVSQVPSVHRDNYFPFNTIGVVIDNITGLNDESIVAILNDAIQVIGNEPPQGFFQQIFGNQGGP